MRYKITMCLELDIDGTREEAYDIVYEDKIEILEGQAENIEIVSVEPTNENL